MKQVGLILIVWLCGGSIAIEKVEGQRCEVDLETRSAERIIKCYGVYSIGDLEKFADERPVKVQVINEPEDRFHLQNHGIKRFVKGR